LRDPPAARTTPGPNALTAPRASPNLSLTDVASFCAPNARGDDFNFVVVAARNGAPFPAASLQSVNFPSRFLAPTGAGLALGIPQEATADDASFTFAPGLANASALSLAALSKNPAFAGLYVAFGAARKAPCKFAAPAADAVLARGDSDAAAATLLAVAAPPPPPPVPIAVDIDARAVDHVIPAAFRGCHMDPGVRFFRQLDHLRPQTP